VPAWLQSGHQSGHRAGFRAGREGVVRWVGAWGSRATLLRVLGLIIVACPVADSLVLLTVLFRPTVYRTLQAKQAAAPPRSPVS
jgi:hypothetical protein